MTKEWPEAAKQVDWAKPKALYWRSALGILLFWSVPALVSLYVKYKVINFFVAAAQLGRIEKVEVVDQVVRHYSDGLTIWEKLSFFRADLLIGLLVVPGCLLLLRRFLPRRIAVATAVLLATFTTVVLFVQLHTFNRIGQFLSFPLIERAINWIWHEPAGLTFVFREGRTLALGCLLIAGVVSVAVWSSSKLAWLTASFSPQRWRSTVAVIMFSGLTVTAVAWIPAVPGTAYHRSILVRAVRALYGSGGLDTREFRALKMPELTRRYREMTHAPLPSRDSHYWGRDSDANVIFFVLETASYRALPLDQGLDDFPNLQRLRQHAFVGLNHRTTFPATSDALFSLFTSWYPDDGAMWLPAQHPDLVPPNIMRTLAGRGYATGVYTPHADETFLYDVLGVPLIVAPGAPPRGRAPGSDFALAPGAEKAWKPKARVARDIATLELMERDMAGWLEQDRRFAVAFLPQISHTPWFEINGPQPDPVKRARALLAYEDAWLGELTNLLQRYNALYNTMIIVMGDHGVRYTFEDPACPVGMADAYTFQVPLLIYAPKALDTPQEIGWVTSHIDVAPTVLDLLGVVENRDFEQGTPIWNPELKNRTTYFFAWHFLGVDSYYEHGKFYMWRHLSDSVYINERQHFEADTQVSGDSPEFHEVERSISRMIALQQVWVAQFYSKKSALRSHIY